MSGQEVLLMLAIAVVIALALIVPIVIADKMKTKKNPDEVPVAPPPTPAETEITAHARVVDMSCGVESVGYDNYRAPKVEKDFVIVFETDDGEQLRYPVDEEIYDGFEIGLAGMLSVVKGKLNSFVPDGGEINEDEGDAE